MEIALIIGISANFFIAVAIMLKIFAVDLILKKHSSKLEDLDCQTDNIQDRLIENNAAILSIQMNTNKLQNLDKLKALDNIDSSISQVHNKITEALKKVKGMLQGVDENTYQILSDFHKAIESQDVQKLAAVERAAKALTDNYEAIHQGLNSIGGFDITSWMDSKKKTKSLSDTIYTISSKT